MNIKSNFSFSILLLIMAALLLAACGGGTSDTGGAAEAPAAPADESAAETGESAAEAPSGEAVTIRYTLWDSAQQPAYELCAAAFTEANPNIIVQVEQAGWDDYWNTIQTGFVSGDTPDVFTDHLAKYPEFAAKEQIVDIQPLVERDSVDTGIYIEGLADLWVREGKRYGLPKDWDTIAVVYNADMLAAAGIDPAVMESWTWNPQDGGSFEETIAQLTLDENGNNGLSPDFDKDNVEQYGFIHQGSGGFSGQTQWSHFAASNGFKFTDGPWATHYYYDDPKLAETLDWYVGLIEKGFAPPLADVSSLGAQQLVISGKGAMTTDGSWQIGNFVDNATFEVGFGLLPVGPEGRKSMFNGLADSIYIGTEHMEEAWEWVKFAASPECANIVGDTGIVFPAIQSGVERSLAVREERGIDVSAYTEEALDPQGTFLFPITDNGAEISAIMDPTMDSIVLGQVDAATALQEANEQVNALFE
ncbi:MAG: sugar ABC transporter substrate-binding protein [Anaerolineales bacterium]|nr:sugar ABC transporter substrate-binding protein [Anaerolineales bacterium]